MLGTATVSGRLARTDRVYIGIDVPAGLVAGRALRSAPKALPALREQPEHARRARRKQEDVLLARTGHALMLKVNSNSQWHVASVAIYFQHQRVTCSR